MAKITLKQFFESKTDISIHCDTIYKAKKLCQEFAKLGKTWCTGQSYSEITNWEVHEKDTVYYNDGSCGNRLDFIESYFYSSRIILEFEDIIFD